MRTVILLISLTILSGCGKKPDVPKPGEPQGRAETQSLRQAGALGYSGSAVADKVDGALDANDQRKATLDAAIDDQSKPQ